MYAHDPCMRVPACPDVRPCTVRYLCKRENGEGTCVDSDSGEMGGLFLCVLYSVNVCECVAFPHTANRSIHAFLEVRLRARRRLSAWVLEFACGMRVGRRLSCCGATRKHLTRQQVKLGYMYVLLISYLQLPLSTAAAPFFFPSFSTVEV